jgi:hypothetical protein
MKLSGSAPRPWVKLWKEERGSFAQLPFMTRAVAAEALKYLDDDGRMYVGSKHPAEALAFVAGATRGDRRVMRNAIDELLADGYLRTVNGWLEAAHYSVWQYGDKPSADHDGATNRNEAVTNGNDGATTEQRTETTAQRPRNESRAKSAKRLERKIQEGEVELEKREIEKDTAPSGLTLLTANELKLPSTNVAPKLSSGDAASAHGQLPGLVIQTPPPTEPKPSAGARELFEHWRSVMGKSPASKLDDKRKRRCEWAIREYGLEAARLAIDGCARSDFHMGRDPKTNGDKHNDLTLIFRDAAHFEKFRDLAARPLSGRVEPLPNDAYKGTSQAEIDEMLGTQPGDVEAYERNAKKGFFYG